MALIVWITIVLAALTVAGVVYQWLGLRRDARLWPPPGRMVNIGDGRRIHLYALGAGGPAVVFESGISATCLSWTGVQAQVAGFARAHAYDRAWLGWSDPWTSRLRAAGPAIWATPVMAPTAAGRAA